MLLQNTFTLVARYKGKIVGTQSFILDSEFGVPLDKVYSEELGRLRAQKRCFMECGALAVAPGFRGKGVALLMNKMMFMCAERVVFIDDIVVSVSYYMEDFYRAMGWFRPFGPLRVYPGLNHNAMSIAMKVDVLNARKECFEKFAHKPRKSSNLYYTMLEQQHPQIQLPASLDPARRARWEAARRFMDADEELRAAWIGAGSPSPSFGSPVQVTETAPPFCVACCHI
jgi:GNAT superfamily N-acetyltransferase